MNEIGLERTYKNEVHSIKVVNLILQQTGTYNKMFLRPYTLEASNKDIKNLAERIGNFGHGKITGKLLTGLASNIITPIAYPEADTIIPNGWDERRLKFLLVVECQFNLGPVQRYFIQGYTNFYGLTNLTGKIHLDPTMEFIINSIIGVSYNIRSTPHGQVMVPIINESIQVLENPSNMSLINANNNFLIRPTDVYSDLQLAFTQTYGGVCNTGNIVNFQPKTNSRANNTSTEYLGRILDSYMLSKETDSTSSKSIIDIAKQYVRDNELSMNPVITMLSNIYSVNSTFTTRFNLQALEEVDNNLKHVINVITERSAIVQQHTAGETSYWNGSDRETMVANILINAIPTLMTESLMQNVKFTATNTAELGANTVWFIEPPKSIAGIDLTRQFEIFKRRFIEEVMYDITFGNSETYELTVFADLYGEIRLKFRLGNYPEVEYASPSFCDSLYVPILTNDSNHIHSISNGFNTILNTTDEALYDNSGLSGIISTNQMVSL